MNKTLADILRSYIPDGDGYNSEYAHNLNAAADALESQQSAPAGYVLVPVEPTDAMKLAGNDALAQHWGAGDAYRAMLAASRLPVQPVQGMSNRSKRLDEIRAEAELFFEWPGDDRSTVTLTSCILFADHIAAPSSPAAQDGWIPVSEGLPESATDVLVYGINHGSRSYTVAGLFSGSWASQETEETTRFEPTHWMPLPSAPKGGE